jgi:hypothetical protein
MTVIGARVVRGRRLELRFAGEHAREQRRPFGVGQQVVDDDDRVADRSQRGLRGRFHE